MAECISAYPNGVRHGEKFEVGDTDGVFLKDLNRRAIFGETLTLVRAVQFESNMIYSTNGKPMMRLLAAFAECCEECRTGKTHHKIARPALFFVPKSKSLAAGEFFAMLFKMANVFGVQPGQKYTLEIRDTTGKHSVTVDKDSVIVKKDFSQYFQLVNATDTQPVSWGIAQPFATAYVKSTNILAELNKLSGEIREQTANLRKVIMPC